MRVLLLLIAIYVPFATFANDESTELPPLDPAYMGIHGMVLFSNGSTLYASHLPTYNKPHDAQIIYRVFSDNLALNVMVKDADLVTLKQELLNLQRLMRGESFEHKVDAYLGHFERGGMRTYENLTLRFDKLVYLRKLENLEPSSRAQVYDVVPVKNKAKLLVHHIQQAPSYDHIVLLYQDLSCVTRFNSSTAVPKQGELLSRLSFCGSMKPIYYETQDFR